MTTISLDMYQACALAALVYCLGRIMKQKLAFLDRYCIPAPVAGGVVFALVHLALYSAGILELTFDTTLQSVFMTIFFCSVGFTACFRLLKKGDGGQQSIAGQASDLHGSAPFHHGHRTIRSKAVFQTFGDQQGTVIGQQNTLEGVLAAPELDGLFRAHNIESGGEGIAIDARIADDGNRLQAAVGRLCGCGVEDMMIGDAILRKVAFIAARSDNSLVGDRKDA